MKTALSLRQQAALLKLWFPDVQIRHDWYEGNPVLCAMLWVQPTPISIRYRLAIRYAIGYRPRVNIASPEAIVPTNRKFPPHLFTGNALCLHDSSGNEWHESEAIAYTIVEWAKRWLFHYEYWLEYDEWLGDEELAVVDASAGPKVDSGVTPL